MRLAREVLAGGVGRGVDGAECRSCRSCVQSPSMLPAYAALGAVGAPRGPVEAPRLKRGGGHVSFEVSDLEKGGRRHTFFTPTRPAREPPREGAFCCGVLDRRSLPKILAARASFFLRSRARKRDLLDSGSSNFARSWRAELAADGPSCIIFSKSDACSLPAAMSKNRAFWGGGKRRAGGTVEAKRTRIFRPGSLRAEQIEYGRN